MPKGGFRSGAGRPAKTDEQKALEGTFRKDRANDGAPTFPALIGQEPPPWLDKIAKEHWLYYAEILGERPGLLTAADISLLTAASERWSVYQRAASLMKGSVRGKKYSAQERLRLAEQDARAKLLNMDADLADILGFAVERKKGKLRRGNAPSGNEVDAEPVLTLDKKLLGEWAVPPQHSIASQALHDYMQIMREFGVGPASRGRVKLDPPTEPDEFEAAFG